MKYVLGLDLGTGSLKGVLLNNDGYTVHIESSNYSLSHPKNGYSEQNPNDWLRACDDIFEKMSREVDDFTENLEGISFSGQMHSLVVTNDIGDVLHPAILWNDVRTTEECKEIMDDIGDDLLLETKNIALEGFTLPKILWIKKNEPQIWSKTKKIFLPKDYLRYYLTGKFHMDYSDAAGTLLMNTTNKKWSDKILDRYQISEKILPELVGSMDFISNLKSEIKEKYNLKKNVKVFAGGADNAISSIGAGLRDSDTAIASTGTSGVFLSLEEKNHDEYAGKVHLFNHALPNQHYSMGVTLAAGHSVSWFKNLVRPDESYEEFFKGIENVPVGSKGLLFTPYISGERTPHIDSSIRGSFIGLSSTHTIDDLKRAVIEGVTFSLKDSQTLMEELANKKFKRIISIGGGAKNKEWLQIQADIFDAQVVSLTSEEGPGLGAAMIAAMGLNWFDSMEECINSVIEYKEQVNPIKENVEKYKNLYELYRELYNVTKSVTKSLNTI